MQIETFRELISRLTGEIAGKPLDASLGEELNRRFPPDSEVFKQIESACHAAIASGWMCNREAGGIQFGRVIKPGPETHGFSVDVVRMRDCAGPHHRHPQGEIDLIMPTRGDALFDGHAAGWHVYPPDSAHYPTVSEGEALILYLLPEGQIEFTRNH